MWNNKTVYEVLLGDFDDLKKTKQTLMFIYEYRPPLKRSSNLTGNCIILYILNVLL